MTTFNPNQFSQVSKMSPPKKIFFCIRYLFWRNLSILRQTYFWSILGGNRSGLMDEFLTGCKFNLLLPPTMSAQPQDFMDVGVHTSEIWREVLVNVVVSVHIGSCTTKTTTNSFPKFISTFWIIVIVKSQAENKSLGWKQNFIKCRK